MGQVSEMAYNAIVRYYNALTKKGYVGQSVINGLLALCFIDEMFDWFAYDITEKDYTVIMRALECLGASNCLIDLPTYGVYVDTLAGSMPLKPRITESSIHRMSSDDLTRVVN